MIEKGKAMFWRLRAAIAPRQRKPATLDTIFCEVARKRPTPEATAPGEYAVLGVSSAGRPLLDFFQARDWAAVTTVESFDPKDDDIIVFVLREGNGPYAVVPILDPYGLGMPRLLEGYPPVYLTSHESVSVSRLPIANWHPISLGD